MAKKTFMITATSGLFSSILRNQELFVILDTPLEGFLRRQKKIGTCGQYSLKAVIEGKLSISKPMREYSGGWRSRSTYLMSPWALKKVLQKHGLNAKIIRGKRLSFDEKLILLQQELQCGPLILLIGNGFTATSYFSWRKAITHWHYITLRGYNDKEKVFYIYDSNSKRVNDNSIMPGTLKIPYSFLIKSWSLGATKLLANYAIGVSYK